METNPLKSLADYSQYVVRLLNRQTIRYSTVISYPDSLYTGIAEGEIFFLKGIQLRIREEIDFEAGLLTAFGYEVYQTGKRLFWYDDFPHPHDTNLAPTFPHHKHVPPDIKHNRIPAEE